MLVWGIFLYFCKNKSDSFDVVRLSLFYFCFLDSIRWLNFNLFVFKDIYMSDSIRVAVVGAPGSGKSLFCEKITHYVGTYGGGRDVSFFELVNPEDLMQQQCDVVVQMVDCADLEESLVVTPQLIDMHKKLVLCLTRMDKLEASGHWLDYNHMADLMGVGVAKVDCITGDGLDMVFKEIVDAADHVSKAVRHIHVDYGVDVENAIGEISDELKHCPHLLKGVSKRYLSIRLLEMPERTLEKLNFLPNYLSLAYLAEKNRRCLSEELKSAPEEIIHMARHGFISGALKITLKHVSDDKSEHTVQHKVDALLTHRFFGFVILVAVLYAVFQSTFYLGSFPQDWIQMGVDALCGLLSASMNQGWFSSLLVDGVVQGVGAVLAFLPNIVILFFFISLMEDSGYMSRVAFLMDKIMHKVGLHGKSFIPMLMGFGCNVPAIMAARSISNTKDRVLTMLMIPFMSCSARLPVYMLFVDAFFENHKSLVMISLYLVGILISIIFAMAMKRTSYFKSVDEDYVTELPQYRRPTLKNTGSHIWERCADYLKKIATVILWASIVIWALYYFPRNEAMTKPYQEQIASLESRLDDVNLSVEQNNEIQHHIDSLSFLMDAVQKEHSSLATIGKWMSPVMRPLGFDWRLNVCILTGLPAKEAIVSTMGILYHQNSDDALCASLKGDNDFTPIKAYSFLLFVLLYFPCIATVATLWREIGWKWAVFTIVNSIVVAWLVSFGFYQLFSLF